MKTYNIHIAILFLLNVANSFVFGPNKLNCDEAQAYCVSICSNLASITSLCEQMLAEVVCSKSKPENTSIDHQGCWSGLNDKNSEGQFSFIDGTPFDSKSYTNWNKVAGYAAEPNNLGNEDCVEISFQYTGKWK
eukprot:206263_1